MDYSFENMREYIEKHVVNLRQPELDSYGNDEIMRQHRESPTIPLTPEQVEAMQAEIEARRAEQRPEDLIVILEKGYIARGLVEAIGHMKSEIYAAYTNTEEYKRAKESLVGKTTVIGNLSWIWEKVEGRASFDRLQALTQLLGNFRNACNDIGDKLTQAAKATQNMPNATAEERAMQREAVVRMASEIAGSFVILDAYGSGIKNTSCTAHIHEVGAGSACWP